MPADPRIAPVENNLIDFLQTMEGNPHFARDDHPDATAFHHSVAFPLFNGIAAARFAPGHEVERTREVLAPYVERARPFLWWTTPSTTSEAIDRVLIEAGLEREDSPGMWASLAAPIDVSVTDLEIVMVGPDDTEQVARTMVEGFAMPTEIVPTMTELIGPFDQTRLLNVLARLDGAIVGVGSIWLTGTTVGLYNIATLERARGRGIGYAVTAALMELGRQRGGTEAILESSVLGRPVYERLGFTEVCTLSQYLWLPPGPTQQ